MLIDALVLTGGRSSRLDAVPKASLKYGGQTLVERAVAAVAGCRFVAIVGDGAEGRFPRPVIAAREDPPFGGPVAAVEAGLSAVLLAAAEVADFTAVLACDMPQAGTAVAQLTASLPDARSDGAIAITPDGRLQPLLAMYRTTSLVAALSSLRGEGTVSGASMFRLIGALSLRHVPVSREAAADVDTWSDARRWGIADPRRRDDATIPQTMGHEEAKEQR